MLNITLPDGSIKEFEGQVTPLEVAKSISDGLARNTISAIVDGKQVEVDNPLSRQMPRFSCLLGMMIWVKRPFGTPPLTF